MSFDGIVTKSIVEQLSDSLTNGKINKINQPDPNCLIFTIYNNRSNLKLLIDASSNSPRINITEKNKENPLQAPNFCMLLRKHLQGGIIDNIRQSGLDRVINIDINSLNELGDEVTKTLIIELMGKYSNIILIEKESSKIIDSIKRITIDISRVRQVLPGMKYEPILDDKVDITKDIVIPSEIIENLEKPVKLFRFFYTNYIGFSPQISREICYMSNLDYDIKTNDLNTDDLKNIDISFNKIVGSLINREYEYNLYKDSNDKVLDYHVLALTHLGNNIMTFETPSSLVDSYFNMTTVSDTVGQKISNINKVLKTVLTRNLNKLEKLKKEELESLDRDKYKVWADLISANSHIINKGDKILKAENFYDPDLEILEIKLNETKSPWENAQIYYKKYSKLKTSNKLLQTQIPKIEDEIKYIEQVMGSLKFISTNSEINEIRKELEENNYIKKKKRDKRKDKPSSPLHYVSENGADIYVGKNNFQNDQLTLKIANKNDYFIHAKDIPGSHVLLRNNNINDDDILTACSLAAYYSSGSTEDNVLVDYTYKKNVRKSRNAKPGMVYYDNYETVNINLKQFNIDKIKILEK